MVPCVRMSRTEVLGLAPLRGDIPWLRLGTSPGRLGKARQSPPRSFRWTVSLRQKLGFAKVFADCACAMASAGNAQTGLFNGGVVVKLLFTAGDSPKSYLVGV